MRAVVHSEKYLCVTVPTIKGRDLDDYEEITKCKSCSYVDLEFSHPQLQLQHVYIHLDLDWEKSSLLITTENATHKYSLFLK